MLLPWLQGHQGIQEIQRGQRHPKTTTIKPTYSDKCVGQTIEFREPVSKCTLTGGPAAPVAPSLPRAPCGTTKREVGSNLMLRSIDWEKKWRKK